MKPPSSAWTFSLLGCVLAAPAAAQATWVQTPTTLAPPARKDHAAAYDIMRGRLVMFGGLTTINDTWELAGATWVERTPAQAPAARRGCAMAYHPGHARVVLFGGTTTAYAQNALADTWEWDGVNWTQCQPVLSPSARMAHAMAADLVNGRVVLFGGRDTTFADRNDTWAWDGTNWVLLALIGPSPRCCFDIVQDIVRARIVLFGGWSQGQPGDTWEFDGTTWQQMLPQAAPTARFGHRMSYDLGRNQMILHGGIAGSGESWQWDGVTWTLLDTSVGRSDHVLVHDWQVGRATMFGGWGPNGLVDTTWTFGVAVPATVTPFGSACAGPMGTPLLARQGTTLPSIGSTVTLRAAPVTAFALLLFGWSNTASGSLALPYSLAPHGAPGCSVRVSPDAVFGVVAGSGSAATLAVPVPFAPSLVGMQFFNQAVSFDAGANPLGLTTSNGLRSTIGWQ